MGCISCSDTDGEELASDSSSFEQTKGMADSLFNCMQFRDAYDLYLQLLNSKEAAGNSEKRLSVLNSLCNASELSGHKAEEDEWLEQMLDLATQTRNSYYLSMGLIKMGQNVFYEGDHEQGIQYVGEAIDLIEKNDRSDADHLTHSYLILLARLYGEMKDYDTALKTNEQNLQLTMQGTRWGTAQNQQLIDRRMALAKLAAILARMRNFQRADSAYAAWKAVKYEGNHTRDYFIVDYLKRRGRYQEAIPIYLDLIRRVRQQGDTLGEMMNTAKWGLAEVYRKMGNCEKAAILYEQVLEIQDTLKSRKAKNSAQQLAAVYHDKEQDQVIMEQKAENTRQKAILIIELLVLLGIAALALVVIVKNRAIRHKNRLLAQQIADALKYKEKYLKEKFRHAALLAVKGACRHHLRQRQHACQDEQLHPTTTAGVCRPASDGAYRPQHRPDCHRQWFQQQCLLQQLFSPALRHVTLRLPPRVNRNQRCRLHKLKLKPGWLVSANRDSMRPSHRRRQ